MISPQVRCVEGLSLYLEQESWNRQLTEEEGAIRATRVSEK